MSPALESLFQVRMTCGDTFWPVWRFRCTGYLDAVARGLELAAREVAWRRRATGQRQPPAGAELTVAVQGPDGQESRRTVKV